MLHKLVHFFFQYGYVINMKYNYIHVSVCIWFHSFLHLLNFEIIFQRCRIFDSKVKSIQNYIVKEVQVLLLLPPHSTIPTLCRQTIWIRLKFIYSSCVSLHKIKNIHIFSDFLLIYSEKLAYMCVCVCIIFFFTLLPSLHLVS